MIFKMNKIVQNKGFVRIWFWLTMVRMLLGLVAPSKLKVFPMAMPWWSRVWQSRYWIQVIWKYIGIFLKCHIKILKVKIWIWRLYYWLICCHILSSSEMWLVFQLFGSVVIQNNIPAECHLLLGLSALKAGAFTSWPGKNYLDWVKTVPFNP